MRAKKIVFISGLTLVAILAASCSTPRPDLQGQDKSAQSAAASATPETESEPDEIQAPEGEAVQDSSGSSRRVNFQQLGISLEVPNDLYVHKDPLVSFDDPGRLDSYLFYIQNYGAPGGPSSGDFQIYGILQYNLPPTTWDVFAENVLNSPMNAYATEIEVNGLRGFDTQLSGERNRFVYQFLLGDQILSLAVSQPTEVNKALADQIISSLQYDPAGFTDSSGMQLITEPNSRYQIYLPQDWSVSSGPTGGVRVSDLQAESADAEILIEETEGPHSNIYYKGGIIFNLAILEDDTALMEPVMAEIIRVTPVMYSGVEMTDYVFREPSTLEGEIRELRFLHNGLSYLLRFSYAQDADQDLIEWIIINLQLATP